MNQPIIDIGILTIRDDEFRAGSRLLPTITLSIRVGTANTHCGQPTQVRVLAIAWQSSAKSSRATGRPKRPRATSENGTDTGRPNNLASPPIRTLGVIGRTRLAAAFFR